MTDYKLSRMNGAEKRAERCRSAAKELRQEGYKDSADFLDRAALEYDAIAKSYAEQATQ